MIKFRLGLMHRLLEEGYDLHVLAPRDDHTPRLEETGVHYTHIDIDNDGANPLNDLKLLRQLTHLYKKIDPDLIFHYTIKPNIYGTIAARVSGKPSVAIITGLGYTFLNDTLRSRVAKMLYRLSLRHADEVWFINPYDRQQFLEEGLVIASKTALLPGEGVNTRSFAPRPSGRRDGEFRFAMIARLLWDKGVGEYVKASAELKKRYPNVVCDIVGFIDTHNPQTVYEKQISDWVARGYVNFRGPLQDVREYIADCDAIVLPSYREGLSMILMEAASMAKPIITTDVPGCKDIVLHDETGFLCRAGEYRSLMEQMERMLSLTPAERDTLGRAARRRILETYDEKIVLGHYLSFLRKRFPPTLEGFEPIRKAPHA